MATKKKQTKKLSLTSEQLEGLFKSFCEEYVETEVEPIKKQEVIDPISSTIPLDISKMHYDFEAHTRRNIELNFPNLCNAEREEIVKSRCKFIKYNGLVDSSKGILKKPRSTAEMIQDCILNSK